MRKGAPKDALSFGHVTCRYGPTPDHAVVEPDSKESVCQFVCQTHWTSQDPLELRGLEQGMGLAKSLSHKASLDLTGFPLTSVEQFQDLVCLCTRGFESPLSHQ